MSEIYKVRKWSPLDLPAVAAEFRAASAKIAALTVQFRSTTSLGGAWRGTAGEAAAALAVEVASDIETLTKSYDACADAVLDVVPFIEDAHEAIWELETVVRNHHEVLDLSADGELIVAPYREPPPDLQIPGTDVNVGDILHFVEAPNQRAARERHEDAERAGRRAFRKAEQACALAVRKEIAMAGIIERELKAKFSTPGWVDREVERRRSDFSVDKSLGIVTLAFRRGVPTRGDMNKLYDNLEQMTPDEIAEFLERLPSDVRDKWLAHARSGSGFQSFVDSKMLAMVGAWALTLSEEQWDAAAKKLPFLQTAQYPGDKHSIKDLTGSLFVDGMPDASTDINQGAIGNCYVLVALAAIAQQNPNAIKGMIRDNGNDTYTVTLYGKDGKPFQVTVNDDVPFDKATGRPAYGSTLGGNWAVIMEKALAKAHGGYGSIGDGGYPEEVLTTLMGPRGRGKYEEVNGDTSFGDLAGRLRRGDAITASTKGGDDTTFLDPKKQVVGGHAYVVVKVSLDAGTVTLQNPWGQGTTAPQYVTLTKAEFQKYFHGISSSTMKK